MATTFLQAVQNHCIRNRFPGGPPTSVTSATIEYQRAIQNIQKAHKEIVSSHMDWDFLWSENTVDITVGNNPYTPNNTDVRHPDKETFYLQLDGRAVQYCEWTEHKKIKPTPEDLLWTGPPETVTFEPSGLIFVRPEPDQTYMIDFDYWRTATPLVNNADVLDIPDDVIETLYDRAMMLWQQEEESPIYQLADRNFTANYALMENRYWPGSEEAAAAEDQQIEVIAV